MSPGDDLVERDRTRAEPRTARQASKTSETSDSRPSTDLRDTLGRGVREMSRTWWWFLILGIAWIWYGRFVLS
jgi:hypothetical protein